MHIRDATLDDLPAIVAIYNASIPGRCATADTRPISVESRHSWFERHGPTRPLWVAEQDRQVTGYLSFRNFYGRPAYHITAELAVYVHPDFHSRGIGAALLERAIAVAPSLGLENLLAFVFAHNEPSIRLFKRFGFQEWGRLPSVAELDGRRVALAILGRSLERTLALP
jgi:L-amino acid N-acyltransferase YncA